jgi:hypothetical protein
LFSWTLPPFDGSKTPTDVSFLNDAPAGKHGFIGTRGEQFVDGQGKPIRFWGVNLNFGGVFPDKKDAPGIAARLAKFGFNAVRLHHYEGNAAPNGIWKAAALGSSRLEYPREFDADMLDRMDFLMAELIKRGIYINLNLHVARKTADAEGVTSANLLPEKDKGTSYFDPRLIQLQQEFAQMLLTHKNPYTNRALKDEPGICAIEVANENSLLGMWLDGTFKAPPEYARALRTRWNDWLHRRYDEVGLRAAWTEVDDPLDYKNLFAYPVPYQILNPDAPDARGPVGLNSLGRLKLATVTGAQGTIQVDPTDGPTVDGFVRAGATVSLNKAGTVSWAFQVNRDGLDLQENQPYTLTFWARTDTPRRISVNLWQDRAPNQFQGFTGYADLTTDWQEFSFTFRPSNPDPGHSRLSWNLGNAVGAVQLGEISLRTGGRIAAPPEWTLDRGVPLIDFKLTPVWNARRDYAEFLSGIEQEYSRKMRGHLKETLGVRAPLWISQVQFGGWGGMFREELSDATDVHAYWKHPSFGGAGWSGSNWTVGNSSMTQAAAIDPLSAFAHFRTPGKPFVMSEWNSGQPNDFGGESLLMVASYAAWQDWASVYLFDYHSSGSFDRNKIEGFFSIDSHPVKMVTAPAAALLYRRSPQGAFGSHLGDLAPAEETITLTIPRSGIWHEVASIGDGTTAASAIKSWRSAGAARGAALGAKIYTQLGDGLFPRVSRAEIQTGKSWTSDTGQVRWDNNAGLFAVSTPRSKVAAGFSGGKTVDLDEFRINMPASQSNFAVFALSSLDGANLIDSRNLLLTAVGKVENIGMGWNADRSSVGAQWGGGPTQVEGIIATISIITPLKNARVWALDNTGQQRSPVISNWKDGVLTFNISPLHRTLWYQINTA